MFLSGCLKLRAWKYFICIKHNQYIEKGEIVYNLDESLNTTSTLTLTNGIHNFEMDWSGFIELFEGININNLVYYKPVSKFKYLLLKEDPPANYLEYQQQLFKKTYTEIEFNKHRGQYLDFEKEVLMKIAKIRFMTEEVYFQVHETINIAIETMSVYFNKLSDSQLNQEIKRMKDLILELEILSNKINNKETEDDLLLTSLNNHRLLINAAVDSLKKINNVERGQ